MIFDPYLISVSERAESCGTIGAHIIALDLIRKHQPCPTEHQRKKSRTYSIVNSKEYKAWLRRFDIEYAKREYDGTKWKSVWAVYFDGVKIDERPSKASAKALILEKYEC